MSRAAAFATQISIWAIPTIFAIIFHEVMHGFVAKGLGDDTASRAGRLTLNPISHIDLFGTLILPAILLFLHLPVFGYAKPVPVDFRRLRGGRSGMIAVAAVGPTTNIVLGVLSAFAMRALMPGLAGEYGRDVFLPLIYMMRASVIINIELAVFNLIPILPLDGGRVLAGLLPIEAARVFARLEPYGLLILLVLLYTNSIDAVIDPIINALARVLL